MVKEDSLSLVATWNPSERQLLYDIAYMYNVKGLIGKNQTVNGSHQGLGARKI